VSGFHTEEGAPKPHDTLYLSDAELEHERGILEVAVGIPAESLPSWIVRRLEAVETEYQRRGVGKRTLATEASRR
jgi:hypothetical protein